MATLIGRVGIVDKGTWNSGSTYDTLDTITYNNSIYIAKQSTPAGTLPTNTTYWQLAMDSSSLQPKTMSSPVTIGGESKTTVEAAIGALNDTKANQTAISSVETTSTAVSAHAVGSYFINASGQFVKATSAIAVGDTISGSNTAVSSVVEVLDALNTKDVWLTSRTRRNITSDLANLSQAVSEQNLEKYGYKIGDYFQRTSGNRTYTYILADMNTFKGSSTPYCLTTNHIGIVVDTDATHEWHSGDASEVGYAGSTLHAYLTGDVLDNIKADMIALFGGSTGLEHLLSHSKLFTNKFNEWAWSASQYISALTESQISGHTEWSGNSYQEGEAAKPLSIFLKYKWTEIFGARYPWLRNMVSASSACAAYGGGYLYIGAVTRANFVAGLINFY